MPSPEDFAKNDHSTLERLGQPIVLVIVLDLLTLGLYSAARTYALHTELSKKRRHRLFSSAFLHILIVLNLGLCIMRFARDTQPLDETLIMARVGTALLFISLLLIFRRYLRQEWGLEVRPWPLAFLGLWYLQHRINNREPIQEGKPRPEPWPRYGAIILVYVSIWVALGSMKVYRVSNACMEPNLVVGDYVLADTLSPQLKAGPKRGDILVYRNNHHPDNVQIRRVIGLPGDRLRFQGGNIFLNGELLPCDFQSEGHPQPEAFDQSLKQTLRCHLERRDFIIERYDQGPLTAVEGDFVVPPDHYFMIGDNLDNATDSRSAGPVAASSIIGPVPMTTISYRLGEPVPWHRWFQLL